MADTSNTGANQYWLIKFAPFRTKWVEIVRRGIFTLRGVRSREARQNLAKMRRLDQVLFYHSQQELAVVGLMEVTREAYSDPTSADSFWLTCDFRPLRTFEEPVHLQTIKSVPELASVPLIRRPRLAVMPLTETEFHTILALAEGRSEA